MISSDPCRFCPIERLLSEQSPNDEFSHSQWIKFRGGPHIKANSSKPFIAPNYDKESFDAVLDATLELAKTVSDTRKMFGKKEDVDPIHHLLGAYGWGALSNEEAIYLNVAPGLPVGKYRVEVPADVPVGAFWSISLYNEKGYYDPNDRDAYTVNSITGERNADGSMTVHFGEFEDDRPNTLPIMPGWNFTVRLYRPGKSILDGTWKFPKVERVK